MHCPLTAVSFDFGGTLAAPHPPPAVLLRTALGDLKRDISSTAVQHAIDEVEAWYATHSPRTVQEEDEYYATMTHNIVRITGLEHTDVVANALNRCFNLQKLNFRIYPDALPTLHSLRSEGYRICIVSNFWPSLNKILSQLRLTDYFDTVVVSSEVGYEKPDKRIFEIAMNKLNVRPEQMMHVGDADSDLIGAQNAGITPVLIDRNGTTHTGVVTIAALNEILKLVRAVKSLL